MVALKVVAFIIAMTGYYLIGTKHHKIYGFFAWLISNSIWGAIAAVSGEVILMSMFLAYNIFVLVNIVKELKNIRHKLGIIK